MSFQRCIFPVVLFALLLTKHRRKTNCTQSKQC